VSAEGVTPLLETPFEVISVDRAEVAGKKQLC
jgi:hypothetical protein